MDHALLLTNRVLAHVVVASAVVAEFGVILNALLDTVHGGQLSERDYNNRCRLPFL